MYERYIYISFVAFLFGVGHQFLPLAEVGRGRQVTLNTDYLANTLEGNVTHCWRDGKFQPFFNLPARKAFYKQEEIADIYLMLIICCTLYKALCMDYVLESSPHPFKFDAIVHIWEMKRWKSGEAKYLPWSPADQHTLQSQCF